MNYYKIANLVSYMEEKRQKGDLEEAKRIATILDEKHQEHHFGFGCASN